MTIFCKLQTEHIDSLFSEDNWRRDALGKAGILQEGDA